ncbi:amidohydrolase family protein [candidate division KSB1 bacterium]
MFKRFIISLFIVFIAGVFFNSSNLDPVEHYDILIRNGKIVDGSGNPWFFGDIGITDGIILSIGDLAGDTAAETINADGYVVAPGFIDMHTHCDGGLGNPGSNVNLNYLSQGTTTVVTGHCGSSVSMNAMETKKIWEENGIGTNAVFLVGHGDARRSVMGNEPRTATAEEIEEMKIIIRRAMEDGAWGMSTGLEYVPGRYSATEEVIELAKIVGEFGGVYANHMRNENSGIVDAINETVRISRETGVRSSVAHFKVTGKNNWGLMKDAVSAIQNARADGVQIAADQYPYTQSSPIGLISSFIRIPVDMEPFSEIRARRRDRDLSESERETLDERYRYELENALSDRVKREQIRKLTVEGRPNNPSAVASWGWHDFSIMVSDKYPQLVGKNFIDIADEQGRDIFDIVTELIINEPGILYAGGSQSTEDQEYALLQDWVMVSSDGSAHRIVEESDDPVRGHPRNFGSQTRILGKFVREDGLLTLENAVRKMTSLPASFLQMKKRGMLLEGFAADLVIFDPETVSDKATYADSRQYCTGVEYVIVNGKISVENSKYNGTLNGKVLLLTENR